MDKFITLNVLEEFTKTPGVREEVEGKFPGEEFLELHLLPKFNQAIEAKKRLLVNLDGPAGYATSFLEASFGGLVRHFKDIEFVKKNIEFISNDDAYLIDDIISYMDEALDDND